MSVLILSMICAQVEDEVDEINAKVFTELEQKLSE